MTPLYFSPHQHFGRRPVCVCPGTALPVGEVSRIRPPRSTAVQQAATGRCNPSVTGYYLPPSPASLSATSTRRQSLLTATCTSMWTIPRGRFDERFRRRLPALAACVLGRMRSCFIPSIRRSSGGSPRTCTIASCCPDRATNPNGSPRANASFFVDPHEPRAKAIRWDNAYSFWFSRSVSVLPGHHRSGGPGRRPAFR